MKYSELVGLYQKLESTTKKLEKRDLLADFCKGADDLRTVVLLSSGEVFPRGREDLGIASGLMKKIIQRTYGAGEKEVGDKFRDLGDLGLVAEHFASRRKQSTLGKKDLTVERVFENLRKLPDISGEGSQERKVSLVAELLSSAEPKEAQYIVRTILGDMRVGVGHGTVRDAIAKAFDHEPRDVEHVFNLIGDYGRVAGLARKGKLEAKIKIGRPVRVMLAERSSGLEEAMEKIENPAVETKYDGFRVSIHKDGSSVKLFSRRLDEVTSQFPDIVKTAKKNISAKKCVVEGEVLAISPETGNPMPFQKLSRRIQRKYDIEKMVKEIPVQTNLFDVIILDGNSFMKKPLSERWAALEKTVKQTDSFRLADHIETKDYKEAERFYKKSLSAGQEGVIVKNLDAPYKPGRRVGTWLKVKATMEPLDLVVTGAEWGEGKRAKRLGSLILAARDNGKFVRTGRMASGLTDRQLDEITKKLKKLIINEEGKEVEVKPEIVIEVGYEEIQKSPKYPSGYALRFPRLLRFREADKKPEDADTVKTIKKLYKQQKGRK